MADEIIKINQKSIFGPIEVIDSDDCVHIDQLADFVIVGKEDIPELIEALQKFITK